MADSQTDLLDIRGLTIALPEGADRDHAVRALDLSIRRGECVCLVGESGSGKSITAQALLDMLPRGLKKTEGEIVFEGAPLPVGDRTAMRRIRGDRIGLIFQEPAATLDPVMTVGKQIEELLQVHGLRPARARRNRALEMITAVRLADPERIHKSYPHQLSGGQAQRVALARALATEPRLLLLDEPLSALDVTAAPAMRRLLRTMLRERRRTAVLVTHDLLDALAVADDVAVIEHGRVVEHGPARRVLTTPRSEFAARIAGINLVAGRIVRPGTIRTAWGTEMSGTGDLEPGTEAVALCRPSAVAVFTTIPHGSPRNVVPVSIAEMEVHGETVRVRADAQPDGGTGLAADVTATAVADLELEPGATAYFAVKAQEVQLYPAGAASG